MPPVFTSAASSTGIGQDSEHSTELLVLDSLFPVAEHLPGLTLVRDTDNDSGYYYVRGKIDPSDQDSLYNFARRIGEIRLGGEPGSTKPPLATHLLTRIAQLQYPNIPLFPCLHSLRIIDTTPDLDLLHVLLSPALTTLELQGMPASHPRFSSVLSFFECVIHHAPDLSTLILGPGLIQDEILSISFRYQCLRRLELVDVEIAITDQLLQGIGSLQHLEIFVLRDDGDSTYNLKCSPVVTHATAVLGQSQASAFPTAAEITPSPCRSPTGSRSPSISQGSRSVSPGSTASGADDGPTDEAIFEDAGIQIIGSASKLFPALHSLEVCGRFDLIKDLVANISSSALQKLSLDFTASLSAEISPTEIVSLIRLLIQRWRDTLTAVTFENNHSTPFSLPLDVSKHLLLQPTMQLLEITGIGIDSMAKVLGVKSTPIFQLEVLRLPVHVGAPGISLMSLRHMAEIYPHLKSLRCRFSHLSQVPRVSSPLLHQLTKLSVVNAIPHPKMQRLVEIARYLDSTFPNLGSIETYDGVGTNAGQWKYIDNFVKLCQAVRIDERQRLSEVFSNT